MKKEHGITIIGAGVLAILVWALLKFLWLIGIILIVIGIVSYFTSKK